MIYYGRVHDSCKPSFFLQSLISTSKSGHTFRKHCMFAFSIEVVSQPYHKNLIF